MSSASSLYWNTVATVGFVLVCLVLPDEARGQFGCRCRKEAIANFGTFWLYNELGRDSCKQPPGCNQPCSTPTLGLVVGRPGLPIQDCDLCECESFDPPPAASQSVQQPVRWAIPRSYPDDFNLHTIALGNPASFALFPSGERPAAAIRQDFTLRGVNGKPEAHVRTFRADVRLSVSLPGGNVRTSISSSAVGMEFDDNDLSDNIILEPGATKPGADGQQFCRTFSHQYPGDKQPTRVVVLLSADRE